MQTNSNPAAPIGAHSAGIRTLAPKQRRPARPRTLKAEKLPFPDLPTTGTEEYERFFWLYAWARDVAMLAALMELRRTKFVDLRCLNSSVVAHMLGSTQSDLIMKIAADVSYLTKDGTLLYAWVGSTRIPA